MSSNDVAAPAFRRASWRHHRGTTAKIRDVVRLRCRLDRHNSRPGIGGRGRRRDGLSTAKFNKQSLPLSLGKQNAVATARPAAQGNPDNRDLVEAQGAISEAILEGVRQGPGWGALSDAAGPPAHHGPCGARLAASLCRPPRQGPGGGRSRHPMVGSRPDLNRFPDRPQISG
jgi:hypothetical protein